jgi:hypothetical protein
VGTERQGKTGDSLLTLFADRRLPLGFPAPARSLATRDAAVELEAALELAALEVRVDPERARGELLGRVLDHVQDPLGDRPQGPP